MLFLILLIFFPLIASCQEFTISYTVQDISSCDIDLDGDQDLIICSANDGTTQDTLYIFYNDGVGNFTKFAINRTNRIFVICGKIDNDPYPDIITAGNGSIWYIKNNGDGTFGEEISITPSQDYKRIDYIIDMDGDLLNDLVYTYSSMYNKWGILKNEGELSFTDHIVYDDGIGSTITPSIGNLNTDNLPDACLSYTPTGVHFLINNGDLTFDTTLLCSTKAPPQICKLDIISSEDILLFSLNTDELLLFENLGNNTFVNINILPLIGPVMLTDITDFNNDGYDDYCYAVCWWNDCTDSIYISTNDQNWSFSEPQLYYVGQMQLFKTESTDLNGDNFNDIVIYGYYPINAFKILWNDGFGRFSYENPVSIEEKKNKANYLEINICPNPFSKHCSITINSSLTSLYKISIVNIFGRLVKEFESTIINRDEIFEFYWDGKDVAGTIMPEGIYFLNVSDIHKSVQTKKIIKY